MLARALIVPLGLVVCAAGQTPKPDAATQAAMISRIRAAALEYENRLQNFTCIQVTAMSSGPSATGSQWKPLETMETELSFVDRRWRYSILKVNGDAANVEQRNKSLDYRGYGQFSGALQRIFSPKADARFEWDHAEAGSGGNVCVFRYDVPQSTSLWVDAVDLDRVRLGLHGMIWADCESGAVMRYRTETDKGEVLRPGRVFGLPAQIKVAVGHRQDIRYGAAAIGGVEYLLPQSAVETSLFYKTWTKSEIQFQQYRKYDANSTVKFYEVEVQPGP
jgi:hypothetical protein